MTTDHENKKLWAEAFQTSVGIFGDDGSRNLLCHWVFDEYEVRIDLRLIGEFVKIVRYDIRSTGDRGLVVDERQKPRIPHITTVFYAIRCSKYGYEHIAWIWGKAVGAVRQR
jgi:hypothetical protein